MNYATLASAILGLMEHHPYIITDNPTTDTAYDAACNLNRALDLLPDALPCRAFATPGNTFFVIRVSEIAENTDLLETHCDKRHLQDIQQFAS